MKDSLDIDLHTETLNVSVDLLERFNVPGPRYTSYPTAPEWVDTFGPDDHKREIKQEFGLQFDEYLADDIARLKSMADDGLVVISPDCIFVTALGRIFIRNVGVVFDTYLRTPESTPLFSKTL